MLPFFRAHALLVALAATDAHAQAVRRCGQVLDLQGDQLGAAEGPREAQQQGTVAQAT
jgi:hypothetical protein